MKLNNQQKAVINTVMFKLDEKNITPMQFLSLMFLWTGLVKLGNYFFPFTNKWAVFQALFCVAMYFLIDYARKIDTNPKIGK